MLDTPNKPATTPGSGKTVEETQEQKDQRFGIIEAFAGYIKEKRTDAIEGRRSSGIEEVWTEDEEHYDGIDDANRAQSKILKGRNTSDGLTDQPKPTATRSTVFLKITRPYVDAAAARVSDMLLPTDDRNWALRPTPVPSLIEALKDIRPAGPDGRPAPAMPQAVEQPPQKQGFAAKIGSMFGMGQGVPPAAPAAQAPTVASMAKEAIDKAKASAERAQEEIDDWLVECRYHPEVRKIIESAAKVGTGILKGPHPALSRKRAALKNPDGSWTVEVREDIAPTSKAINHWNFFPDPACGDNIHRGSYVFECDDITARGLLDLRATPGYLVEMIDQVIEEGPTDAVSGTRKLKPGDKTKDKDLFQIWYFHGQVSKKDMEAAGCKCNDGKQTYPAMVTMVNDRVIKVTLSPLDTGEFPYDVMVWQAKTDHWAGVGVARQMRECQKGANAAVRNLMDNAGLSAGPQIVVDRSKVRPQNGRWELVPRKIWWTVADEEIADVTKAFTIVSIETRQAELMNILQFWLKEAEDVTGLPMLLQGQQGNAPDTVGGMQIMNNNGSTVLRRIARTFDDRVTEPHIGRYYEWLLLYGPDEAKGEFTIDARGSSALVERDLQNQALPNLLAPALNPAYGLDPELVMRDVLKSMRLDPKGLELSEEKKQAMANRPPPEDPRITAAKIMSKDKGDALVADAQLEKMRLDHEAKENQADRDLKEVLAGIDARLEQANLSSEERQHLETMKVRLADTKLRLMTQENLSIGAHAVDMAKHREPAAQVIKPAAEPAGTAPPGKAFTA
jgi:hypothetical protein